MKIYEVLNNRDLQQYAHQAASEVGDNVVSVLGSGEWGTAFGTSDGKVIKVTTNEEEYEIAGRLAQKNIPHVVNIYKVFNIEDVYIIYQEKLVTDPRIKQLFNKAKQYIRDNDLDWADPITDLDPVTTKFIGDIGRGLDALAKFDVPSADLAWDNIGSRGADFVLFDIMSNWDF